MEFHGVLYHLPRKVRRERTEMLLKLFDLWERRGSMVKQFSGGMKSASRSREACCTHRKSCSLTSRL